MADNLDTLPKHVQSPIDVGACDHLFGMRVPFPFLLLSDADLAFARTLRLPTFEVEGRKLIKRLNLILHNGVNETCFYPLFDPSSNAAKVTRRITGQSEDQVVVQSAL